MPKILPTPTATKQAVIKEKSLVELGSTTTSMNCGTRGAAGLLQGIYSA